jgi:hypothetical protein
MNSLFNMGIGNWGMVQFKVAYSGVQSFSFWDSQHGAKAKALDSKKRLKLKLWTPKNA